VPHHWWLCTLPVAAFCVCYSCMRRPCWPWGFVITHCPGCIYKSAPALQPPDTHAAILKNRGYCAQRPPDFCFEANCCLTTYRHYPLVWHISTMTRTRTLSERFFHGTLTDTCRDCPAFSPHRHTVHGLHAPTPQSYQFETSLQTLLKNLANHIL